jgi:hypothetical protein
MIVATWRPRFSPFKADAQRVAEEIQQIGNDVTPQQIVDRAKDEASELHKCFEWDNEKAADKYRLYQARQVVCHLVIKDSVEKPDSQPIRVFHKTDSTEGYKPFTLIVKDPDEYSKLLERARMELRAFKSKYHSLSELEEIMALID